MATAEEYIKASDNANDYADSRIDKLEQDALEEMDYLMSSPEGRDAELWAELGIDEELTLADYDEIDDDERGLDWVEGMAGLAAGAQTQYFLDKRDETIIKPLAYREQLLGAIVIARTELMKASRRGFNIEGTARFAELQSRYVSELSFMRFIDDRELYNFLLENGAMQPIEKTIAGNVGYVSRMTNYRPGSPQFKEAVSDLVSSNSKRGLKAQNRRAVEKIYTLREVDGDMSALMAWMVEGGKNTCSYCLARAGEVKPYSEWVIEGLPGADVCKGADLCNCHLAAI